MPGVSVTDHKDEHPPEAGGRLRVRDARPEEYGAIADVTLAAYRQYADVMPAAAWENYAQNIVTTITHEDALQRIVAEIDGRTVGSVLYFTAEVSPFGAPMVRLLAVAPEARGQGVGTALMGECLRRARLAGAPSLVLHTTMLMDIARRMYEHMGFVRAPELDFRVDQQTGTVSAVEPGGHLSEDTPIVMGYRLDLKAIQSP
jgi:predicted N-acetyltransferase YhbS